MRTIRRSHIIGLIVAALAAVPLQVFALSKVLDHRDDPAAVGDEPSPSGPLTPSGGAAASQSAPPGVPDYWVVYSPQDAGFSVWAPGPMEEQEFDGDITIHRADLAGTIAYTADWFDWYGITDRDAYLLQTMIRRSTRYYEAELVDQEEAPFDGHLGALLRLKNEDSTMLVRMVAVSGRFYTVTATFHRGAPPATREAARVFIDSFDLLK